MRKPTWMRYLVGGAVAMNGLILSLWVVDPGRANADSAPTGGWLAMAMAFLTGVFVVLLLDDSRGD